MTKLLQHLVSHGPWPGALPEGHFKMLELFVTEFNMSFSREDPKSVTDSILMCVLLPVRIIWLIFLAFSLTARGGSVRVAI